MLKKIQRQILCALVLGILTTLLPPDAQGAISLSGWKHTAFNHYRQDEYEKSLRILKNHSKERFSKILKPFVLHQQWVYSNEKSQKTVAKMAYKSLAAMATTKDIDYLVLIGEASDKPSAAKLAKKIIRKTFATIYKNQKVPILVRYVSSPDSDISLYALNNLQRILKGRRQIVNDGGNLRAKDIKFMVDRNLLAQLTAIVSQKEVMGKRPTNAKGTHKAIQCMVFIEEPSMKFLEKASGESVDKAKIKIQKAITRRKKKFPKSSWHSAQGIKRTAIY